MMHRVPEFECEMLLPPVITVVLNVDSQAYQYSIQEKWDSFKNGSSWGAWVARSVKRLTSAQVMISRSVSSSPASGSVLTARSLEPVSDSVSPSLSAPPLFMFSVSLKYNK